MLKKNVVLAGIFSLLISISCLQAQSPVFVDIAIATGLDTLHSLDSTVCHRPELGSGSAWADFNNDGNLDLYVTNHGGANWLYQNLGDTNNDNLPNFLDVAEICGVEAAANVSHGAVFIDYDNDGDQDLYLTNLYGNILYKNTLTETGDAIFVDVTEIAGVADGGRAVTASWADFDGDGWLDFYLSKHFECQPVPRESEDRLFKNNGDGTFSDVTSWLCNGDPTCDQVGGLGFTAGWFDYDNDFDLDLYLINDDINGNFFENVLWRNDGPDSISGGWIFTDVSVASGANISLSGMGLGLGDYDNDGYMDAAFSNFGPNVMIRNNGDGTFTDVSVSAGVDRPQTPGGRRNVTWATAFFDYNNDQWVDLFFAGGPIANNGVDQPNVLFENEADGTFIEVSDSTGLNDPGRGRNASMVDFNFDGFVDLFVANYAENLMLMLNRGKELGNTNNFMTITLEGTISNRDAIGSRLSLTTPDGITQIRDINSGPTHGGGDYRAAYFGMGGNTSGELKIIWPTGEIQEVGTLSSGFHHFIENDDPVGIRNESTQPASYRLEANFPNPFNPATTIRYFLPGNTTVSLKIYNALGEEIRTLVSGREAAGEKTVVWDGRNDEGEAVASGVYIYRMSAGEFYQSRKMLLVR